MSIIDTFKTVVDPITARQEEAERKRQRESKRQADADPPLYRCRVCGAESPDRTYCPKCLADTMEPVPRDKPDPPAP